MANRNRTAGLNWERTVINDLKKIGFSKAVSSRSESKNRDDAKVDACFTGNYNFQMKNVKGKIDYHTILAEMPVEENINVIIHKMTKKSAGKKNFIEVGKYVILKYEDFLQIVETLNNSNGVRCVGKV